MRPIDQAIAAHRSGNLAAAEALYRQVLATNSRDFDALHMLGIVCAQRGQFEEAEKLLRSANAVEPSVPPCLHNHGNVLSRLHRYEEAIRVYRQALAIAPNYAPIYSDLGNAQTALGRLDDALSSHDMAAQFDPRSAQAQYNRGITLFKLGRLDAALDSYDRAISLDRNHAEAHSNRGDALRNRYQYEEALAAYDRAIAVNPNLAEAWRGRGIALFQLKRYGDAIAAFDGALACKADLSEVPGWRYLAAMLICDWRNLDRAVSAVLDATRKGEPAGIPFAMLSMPSSAADQLQCARGWVGEFPSFAPLWRGGIYAHDRIRVAYLSSDFRDHAVAHLTAGLFEDHDKSRFDITAISLSAEQPESDIRRRLKNAFERFIEVADQADGDVAATINKLEIDIVVDLNGFTDGMRPTILSRRPAPIQVNYLGYAGTMGAEHIDYVLADATVLPRDQFENFSEKVVWLPDSYQVCDRHRRVAERTPTRGECGLPETGFVFCCFNAAYKIAPDIFAAWMRMLRDTPDSVLWLATPNPTALANLRAAAQAHSVASDRLIFAPRVAANADHLARHRQADLFLDTLPYNAHTTAADALWAGLPVLTCLGSTMAGRVGASLLKAIGADDLIAASLPEYEALARKLAHDRNLLSALKAKLAAHRDTAALFDTRRFARHIEAAYTAMWKRYQSGQPAASFAVDATDCDAG
jgi:predicted O-linked N-acetylglucosamine transferase (SPINDLY family)